MNALAPLRHLENRNMLWLEVTNFCNLKCAHCYNSSGPTESLEPAVGLARYLDILAEARALAFRRVQFIGGEPLFYPHLREIVDRALALDFEEIEIFSNLTAVPGWLFEPRYRSLKLATSFYSADADVHDRVCGMPNSFARTVASISKVMAAGFDLRAGFIEMDANAGHFERAAAFLRELGVTNIGYDRVREFGRAHEAGEPSLTELCGKCASGNLSIDASGKVSACIMSKPWTFGSAIDTSLADIFASDGRRDFVDALRLAGSATRELTGECFPDTCSPRCDPATCSPNCHPSCYPGNQCNPCSPMGSGTCYPTGRCGPF